MILLIETSSKNCSVALCNDHTLLCLREVSDDQYVHAEKLHVFIGELLQSTQTTYKDLQAVAVGKGPGSYTGLRIGIAAAKGICTALDIPLIAMDTTEILATYAIGLNSGHKYFVPMIDARRDEVYTADYDAALHVLNPVRSEIVTAEYFTGKFSGKTLYIGDGAVKCTPFTDEKNIHICLPSASMMAEPARKYFSAKKFEDPAYFEPFYLKDFIPGIPKKQVSQNI